nr:MAG TPA: portal protein [Caudoviricetes sp.]
MGLINRMADTIRTGLRNFLHITKAPDRTITIDETSNHQTECFINRIWYNGNGKQLSQLYRQLDTNNTRFWSARCTTGLEIRKIHTGLPALICETLVNIVIADYNGTDVTSKNSTAYAERWEAIEKQNKLSDTVKQMLRDLCVVGDGAFKVSFDTAVSDMPIIEWYPAEQIDFTYVRGRIREVKFYTDYTQKHRRYRFEETYGYGYIHYALYDDNGKEIDLHTVDALSWIDSKGVTFDESYMWAVPVLYGKSCHKGRGAGIIGIKTDAFDSLDEVWSQWMDALRACRTKQYVPNCLVPRDPETCQPISPNPFDNRFITVGNDMSENGNGNRIYTESPQIQHESYLSSYITALDLCLQGVISPSTLGIDTKKLDNAEAQREKEKTTLYTRQNLVKITQNALQSLVAVVLNADSELNGNGIVEGLEVSVNFGEYANPSFESQVETVSKARQGGLMSVETSVDELYGDSKSEDWKAEEVQRIKEELGIAGEEETSPFDDVDLTDTGNESDKPEDIANQDDNSKWVSNE